jgi:hypothetical protein
MRNTIAQVLSDPVMDGAEFRAWLYEATTNELEDFLWFASVGKCRVPDPCFQAAQTTLQLRLAKAALEPHWATTPTFIVSVLAALAGLAATALVWLAWGRGLQGSEAAPQIEPVQSQRGTLPPVPANLPPYPSPARR